MHDLTARAGQMQHEARAYAGEVRERVGDMTQSAQERLSDAADTVRAQAHQQTAQVGGAFEYLRTEQPLILGALGFALGAALGAGLPPTQSEDALLGEVRDEYVQKAKAFGEEQLDKAAQVATAAGQAAQAQAEQEGVPPAGVAQQLRDAAGKAARVAHAALEAGKEEAGNQGSSPPSRTP